MFKPAKMRKLKILTLDEYSGSIVSALHEEGIAQIHDISERVVHDAEWRQILKPSKVTPFTGKISSLLMKTTGIVDFLKSAEKKDKSPLTLIKGLINPKIPEKIEVEDLDTESLIERAESLLDKVEGKTSEIENKLNELDSEKNELNNALNVARKLESFDIDLEDLEETKYTSAIAGKLPAEKFEEFKSESASITDKILILESTQETETTIIIVTLKEHTEDIMGILRKLEFERYEVSGLSGKPQDIIKNSETRISEIEKEKEKLKNDLADVSSEWKEKLTVLKEQLDIEKDRNEIFSSFGETENTLMMEAWVPAKKTDETLEIIKEATEGHSVVEVSNPDGDDKVPIHLDNPKFAKPYEMFTHMYSTPTYKEIDPTIFMAIVFPFFFGFCLTDAFYGIVDALVGFILYRGLGKTSRAMRDIGIILVASGIWAFILGMLTNGFIGDLFPKYFNIHLPTVLPFVDAFAQPVNILIIALSVGVIHLNLGLLIGAYNNIKAGEIRDALGTQIVWFILELGVVLFVVLYLLSGLMTGLLVGGPIVLVGVAMLIYINGPFGIMDPLSMLGNLLSYARLLALCLSTGGIALTVNILASLVGAMLPIKIIAYILVPIVFVFGHIINMTFQSLGAFINSLRLHYVELFGQFYIGGEDKFKPFHAVRKVTRLGGK